VIRDEGLGFDVSAVPDPTREENLFRVGGRGLLMIRSSMDIVHHNVCGNQITMVKRIARAAEVQRAVGTPVVPNHRAAEKATELQILL
jgi:anti-sigma regulatory factor (Ser/Thr protein kinase)